MCGGEIIENGQLSIIYEEMLLGVASALASFCWLDNGVGARP